MSLEQLYRNYSPKERNPNNMLVQTHWYSSVAEIDPNSYDAMPQPQPLSKLLQRISEVDKQLGAGKSYELKDRVWRIIEHARQPLTTLFRNLKASPFRDHAIMPLSSVRELDTSSFIALAQLPGRDIREKLANRPNILAVHRYQSVDLPENRLLKAFAERLTELLELRVMYLQDDSADELLSKIRSWLATDKARSIGRWERLPPNNALLSHRDYRRIWNSWRWIQTLDDDIVNDRERREERQNTMQIWQEYGKLYLNQLYQYVDVPVFFDYDNFEIRTWDGGDINYRERNPYFIRNYHQGSSLVYNNPVCIDLTELNPLYAVVTDQLLWKRYPKPFLWQRWDNKKSSNASFDMDLFNVDAVYQHKDATTISSSELFFSKQHTPECLNSAARSFVNKLGDSFKNDALIWLQPDSLNDFELENVRRNINSCFSDAQPLPRSVAAVFENVDYKEVYDGYKFLVQDAIGGKLCATKLEARFDENLLKQLPETLGYYWIRYPSVILSDVNSGNYRAILYNIDTLDKNGEWNDAEKRKAPEFLPESELRKNKRIGDDQYKFIEMRYAPVRGGAYYYSLQQRAGGIPLWRDQIPALSIKASVDGRQTKPFFIVPPKTTIPPRRGQPYHIPLDSGFILQKGKDKYSVYKGNKGYGASYSIALQSPDLPLQKDLKCRLNMTYTYGEDDTYCLIFEPDDPNYSNIHVKWEEYSASAPMFPKAMTWEELRSYQKPDNNEMCDLLEWAPDSVDSLCKLLRHSSKRVIGRLLYEWNPNSKGCQSNAAYCEYLNDNVIIRETGFINKNEYLFYRKGDSISFQYKKDDTGKYSGFKIASADYKEPSVIKIIHVSLYPPIIKIWSDGRSITDKKCPRRFRIDMKNKIDALVLLTQQESISWHIKQTIMSLLSCLHKDAPEVCVEWIVDQINREKIYDFRAVGFALGDVSQPWQKDVLQKLKEYLKPIDETNKNQYWNKKCALRIFAYAIWHEQHFVEQFSPQECRSILDGIVTMLVHIKPCPIGEGKNAVFKWVRATAEPLELLLGMLRTRSSSNKSIKTLLQPNQRITKNLVKLVEHVAKIIENDNIYLKSRVLLGELFKPKDDNTPDLLYALRLYLTGEDAADAIRITGVSDNEKDD